MALKKAALKRRAEKRAKRAKRPKPDRQWWKPPPATAADFFQLPEPSQAELIRDEILDELWKRIWPYEERWAAAYAGQHSVCGICRVRVGLVAATITLSDVDLPTSTHLRSHGERGAA